MASKIYTKTGDQGETQLRDGQRLSKSSLVFEVLGEIDELNCHLGRIEAMMQTFVRHWQQLQTPTNQALAKQDQSLFSQQQQIIAGLRQLSTQLQSQQNRLMQASAVLALKEYPVDQLQPFQEMTSTLEQEIDTWQQSLPELTNFLLPGGHVLAAELMLARAVCRRAERRLVRLAQVRSRGLSQTEAAKVTPAAIMQFMNRLSDWLFVAARQANQVMRVDERIWHNSGSRS